MAEKKGLNNSNTGTSVAGAVSVDGNDASFASASRKKGLSNANSARRSALEMASSAGINSNAGASTAGAVPVVGNDTNANGSTARKKGLGNAMAANRNRLAAAEAAAASTGGSENGSGPRKGLRNRDRPSSTRNGTTSTTNNGNPGLQELADDSTKHEESTKHEASDRAFETPAETRNSSASNGHAPVEQTSYTPDADLAVARPVDDSNALPGEIGIASESKDVAILDKQREEKHRQFLMRLIFGFCVVIGIIVLVVALTTDGSVQEIMGPTAAPTPSPTQSPTSAPTDHVLGLPGFTLQAMEWEPHSPQRLAYQWMLEDPNLDNYSPERRQQRMALVTLFFATGGESAWESSSNWALYNASEFYNVPECEWYFRDDSPACNEDGELVNLVITKNNLKGTLPPEISLLSALQNLQVDDNEFYGTLPTEIGLLLNLKILHLDHNEFTGTVPTEIGQLSASLEELYLVSNHLEDPLPDQLWQLTNMRKLHIAENVYARDKSEASLGVGPIPTEIGLLTNLEEFSNYYYLASGVKGKGNGTLPVELFQLPNLRTLTLEGHHFSGAIPSELGLATALTFLNLNYNLLSQTLPTEVGNLALSQFFYVWGNSLTGKIPTELGLLTDLVGLMLAENRFTGSFPSELFNLPNLTGPCPIHFCALDVSLNDLTGTLPTEMGTLEGLHWLGLNDNSWSGTIPTELGLLTSAYAVDVKNNALSGVIPSELGFLQWANIGGNPLLTPAIPPEVCGRVDMDPSANCSISDFCGCGCECPLGVDTPWNETVQNLTSTPAAAVRLLRGSKSRVDSSRNGDSLLISWD